MSQPDYEIEQFWYGLKENMSNFIDEKMQKEIEDISDKLNKLQSEKKYTEIESIIFGYLHRICYDVMKKKNWYKLCHTFEHIKKWDKISNSNISECNPDIFTILSIINYLVNKGIEPAMAMLDILALYPQNIHQPSVIWVPLFRLGIKNNMVGIIDRLRTLIDIKPFVKGLNDKQIHQIGTEKLMKYLVIRQEAN
jgi:hypothetical protein